MSDEDQLMLSEEDFQKSDEEFPHPIDPLPSTSANFYTNYSVRDGESLSEMSPPVSSYSTFLSPIYSGNHNSTMYHPHSSVASTASFHLNSSSSTADNARDTTAYAAAQHIFTSSLMGSGPFQNSAVWDQWLCCLATSLTPAQWQTYWTNYLALFGTSSLPSHIVNFFNTAANLHLHQQKLSIDERQRLYG